jgi:hypothetical protein
MKYRYLYQTKENENREGWIKARSRDEAYTLLRKQGIKPYRVIGDDPFNWRPWVIGAGYVVLLALVFALAGWILCSGVLDERRGRRQIYRPRVVLTGEEAEDMRLKAAEAVDRAPEAYRYHVWRSVNARLTEMGVEPLEKPLDLPEADSDLSL